MAHSAKIITGIIALFLLIVPNVADWSHTHIYHEAWTGHARLHTVWQLMMQSALALTALYLLMKNQVKEAAFLNLLVLGGFFAALGLMQLGLVDASLTDMTDGQGRIAGIDGNLLAFSVLLPLQLIALLLNRRQG